MTRQRGSGLLDAIAATAIGVLVAYAATDTVGAIRALAGTEDRDRLLVTARNRLERAIAAPCAAAEACPTDLQCTIATEIVAGGPPPLARVRVTVATTSGSVPAATLTGVRREACT